MIKKILKYTGLGILAILILLTLGIVISGKHYIFKALWSTYARGQTGPGIYDKDIFYFTTISPSNKTAEWEIHPTISDFSIPVSQRTYIENIGTTSLLVIHENQIIYEEYWDDHMQSTVSNSFSVAKSYISILVGIAIDKGYINSLDDKVGKYLDWFNEDGKENITIRHLLEMSSGLDWGESGGNPLSHNAEGYYGWDLLGLVKSLQAVSEPGENLNYQSGNTQIIAFLLKEATGMSVSEFAGKYLWSKIGTENEAFWSLDDEKGMEKAFCCLYATTRDFARLGRLINENGFYKGEMIVSTDYIMDMLTPGNIMESDNLKNDMYGLFYWLYPSGEYPTYYARGILGQYIISIPAKDLVIVRTGHQRDEKYVLEDLDGMQNLLPEYQKYKERIGHPSDLFHYVSIGYDILRQSNSKQTPKSVP